MYYVFLTALSLLVRSIRTSFLLQFYKWASDIDLTDGSNLQTCSYELQFRILYSYFTYRIVSDQDFLDCGGD